LKTVYIPLKNIFSQGNQTQNKYKTWKLK
jgi:hypothetical protein